MFGIEVIPAQRRNLSNAEFSKISTLYPNIYYFINIAIIEFILIKLDNIIKFNVLVTVKKFNLFKLMLCRRWKDIQFSKKKTFLRYC